jgi:hypothetical protein
MEKAQKEPLSCLLALVRRGRNEGSLGAPPSISIVRFKQHRLKYILVVARVTVRKTLAIFHASFEVEVDIKNKPNQEVIGRQ